MEVKKEAKREAEAARSTHALENLATSDDNANIAVAVTLRACMCVLMIEFWCPIFAEPKK
ncbi:hypothetical protein BKN38_01710 [Helicobacter sp. CLO-3]|nr:hypothetical protein BA723_04795 [Helicobacter sp. CLO-3]OHU85269.1 hypothetical protein BKN38_01710 [Helicobacter sp. CLO-3]